MYDVLVSIAFWVIFSAMGLVSLAFLLGTFWRSTQLTTARSHIDNGSEDPQSTSFRIYGLSLASDRLCILAGLALLPLAAAALLAFIASTLVASVTALGLALLALIAADAVRERHGKLETSFHQLAGMSVQEAYGRIMDRQMPDALPGISDQSAL